MYIYTGNFKAPNIYIYIHIDIDIHKAEFIQLCEKSR